MKNYAGYIYGSFDNRVEAKRLVSEMQHILHEYGSVTVCDLHDLLGLDTNRHMLRIGWTDLDGTDIYYMDNEGWVIDFRAPHIVDMSYPCVQKEINKERERNKEMLVYKKCKMVIRPKDIKVGNQIEVPLDPIYIHGSSDNRVEANGTFIATAHQITDEGILFIFDDCIARKPMNSNGKNEGGFEKSDLAEWMQSTLYNAFPEELRKRIKSITLPSYGQITDQHKWSETILPTDFSDQLPLMKERKNRICVYDNDVCWYWLKDATLKSYSHFCFAGVNNLGDVGFSFADEVSGVRPAFLLG